MDYLPHLLSFVALVLSGLVAFRQERLKARLSKSVHVHQVQADLEIESYKKLWEKLYPVQLAVASLRPMVDDHQKTKQDRLSKFKHVFEEFQATTHQLRPFIPEAVWDNITSLLGLLFGEYDDYHVGNPRIDQGLLAKSS